MNRVRIHRLLLLTALIHLFADVAFAGGAVLCVGPNDHAKIEVGHLAPGCEPFQNRVAPERDAVFAHRECADCTDIPLHSEAEKNTDDLTWSLDLPAILADSFQTQQAPVCGNERHIELLSDLSPTLRAHQSIVLII